jgi:hypothetical protein
MKKLWKLVGGGIVVVLCLIIGSCTMRAGRLPTYADCQILRQNPHHLALSGSDLVDLFGNPDTILQVGDYTYVTWGPMQVKAYGWGSVRAEEVGYAGGVIHEINWVGSGVSLGGTPSSKVREFIAKREARDREGARAPGTGGSTEKPAVSSVVTGKAIPSPKQKNVVAAKNQPTGTIGKRTVRYDQIANDVLDHSGVAGSEGDVEDTGDKGLSFVLQQYLSFSVNGEGWVTSVEPVEDGGWSVMIDVDAPGGKSDGPEVTALVPPENAKDQAPAVGAKVDFKGRIGGLQVENGRLLMDVKTATVTPAD